VSTKRRFSNWWQFRVTSQRTVACGYACSVVPVTLFWTDTAGDLVFVYTILLREGIPFRVFLLLPDRKCTLIRWSPRFVCYYVKRLRSTGDLFISGIVKITVLHIEVRDGHLTIKIDEFLLSCSGCSFVPYVIDLSLYFFIATYFLC
jgi:hypothetical protein